MMNHGWCENRANIIFNTGIRCAVCDHEFKCKHMSKLLIIFPLCLCKNQQNLVHRMQLQQQCGMCLQFHPNGRAFSKNMFLDCVRMVQPMHRVLMRTGLNVKKFFSYVFLLTVQILFSVFFSFHIILGYDFFLSNVFLMQDAQKTVVTILLFSVKSTSFRLMVSTTVHCCRKYYKQPTIIENFKNVVVCFPCILH